MHQIDPASGKVTRSIGAGLFVFPHGLHVDRDGNIWVTDGQASKDGTKGHQVLKLSPDGKVLMRLGKAGQKGGGPDMFDEPCDVITAPNGDIFVSDGHFGQQATATPATASRIVKFTRDGKFIKEFGQWGAAPGELKTPHAMIIDSRGRLIVADRGNMRIQIYDLDGKLLDSWPQFSRVSGLFIGPNETLYAIDSESNSNNHKGWRKGVRIGSLKDGKVMSLRARASDRQSRRRRGRRHRGGCEGHDLRGGKYAPRHHEISREVGRNRVLMVCFTGKVKPL